MKIRVIAAVVCVAALAAIVGFIAAKRLPSRSIAGPNSTPATSQEQRSSVTDDIGSGLTGNGAKAGGLGKLLPRKP